MSCGPNFTKVAKAGSRALRVFSVMVSLKIPSARFTEASQPQARVIDVRKCVSHMLPRGPVRQGRAPGTRRHAARAKGQAGNNRPPASPMHAISLSFVSRAADMPAAQCVEQWNSLPPWTWASMAQPSIAGRSLVTTDFRAPSLHGPARTETRSAAAAATRARRPFILPTGRGQRCGWAVPSVTSARPASGQPCVPARHRLDLLPLSRTQTAVGSYEKQFAATQFRSCVPLLGLLG